MVNERHDPLVVALAPVISLFVYIHQKGTIIGLESIQSLTWNNSAREQNQPGGRARFKEDGDDFS
jgi:hypothetical protein